MEAQEIFNRTIAHIISMSGPCVRSEDGQCMYRGKGGAKCAAGFWVPDDRWVPDMEGQVILSYANCLSDEAAPHARLIGDLQHDVHDSASSWDRAMTPDGSSYVYTWNRAGLQKNINRVAEKYGLKTVEI